MPTRVAMSRRVSPAMLFSWAASQAASRISRLIASWRSDLLSRLGFTITVRSCGGGDLYVKGFVLVTGGARGRPGPAARAGGQGGDRGDHRGGQQGGPAGEGQDRGHGQHRDSGGGPDLPGQQAG